MFRRMIQKYAEADQWIWRHYFTDAKAQKRVALWGAAIWLVVLGMGW